MNDKVYHLTELIWVVEKVITNGSNPPHYRRGGTDVKSQLQTHLAELDVSFERVDALQKMVRLMEDNIWLGENPVLNNIILDLITR